MSRLIERNKKFLADLFDGPFPGHAVAMAVPYPVPEELGDFAISDRPVSDWADWMEQRYYFEVQKTETLQDNKVPFVRLNTNTGIFAAAFGSPIHVFRGMQTNACALPAVETAAQADALSEADICKTRTLSRILEIAQIMQRRLGPEAIIGVPDIQSPFDVAALVWKKERLLLAMYDQPEAVHRLIGKCHRLLEGFLKEFRRLFPNGSLCHCPAHGWAPPELGCWLSEDDIGSISTGMFQEFVLPSLVGLSRTFGGMFMHCCAAADHQYDGLRQIPNLRGLNRVFQYPPGPRPAIEKLSDSTVFIQAWMAEPKLQEMFDLALPRTRFFIELSGATVEEAKPLYERIRRQCDALARRQQGW